MLGRWALLGGLAIAVIQPAAAIDGNFSYGVGPDDYSSYSFIGGGGVFDTDLDWSLDLQTDYSDGDQIGRNFGVRLDWTPTDWFSANYRRGTADADLLELTSNAFGLSGNVGRLWSERLQSRLDVGFESSDYRDRQRTVRRVVRRVVIIRGRPRVIRRVVLVRQTLEVPTQYNVSIGLTQDLLDNLSIYGSHDFYDYSSDPEGLASSLLRLRRRPVNAIFSLTSFPDSATTVGATWWPTDRLSADLSYGIIDTVIEQRSEDVSLNLNYDLTDNVSMGAGVSYTRSEEVKGARGNTLLDASEGTYYSLSLGLFY
jgi:hypothetical protein